MALTAAVAATTARFCSRSTTLPRRFAPFVGSALGTGGALGGDLEPRPALDLAQPDVVRDPQLVGGRSVEHKAAQGRW